MSICASIHHRCTDKQDREQQYINGVREIDITGQFPLLGNHASMYALFDACPYATVIKWSNGRLKRAGPSTYRLELVSEHSDLGLPEYCRPPYTARIHADSHRTQHQVALTSLSFSVDVVLCKIGRILPNVVLPPDKQAWAPYSFFTKATGICGMMWGDRYTLRLDLSASQRNLDFDTLLSTLRSHFDARNDDT